MEFDTNLKLREVARQVVPSDKSLDEFLHGLWEAASSDASYVAQPGEAEMWLDYSDKLRTRHLIVNAEAVEGGYELRFRGGSKPGYVTDVLMMACLLCAFWLAGKAFVPDPPLIAILGAVLSLAVAGALWIFSGRTFGKEESVKLIDKLK